MADEWLKIIPGVVGAITSFFGNRETNDTNKTLTRETNSQNERLMREQWAREDNAVYRRAQDLQNAGLSKALAAGSPASAGSLAQMETPQVSNSTQTALDTAYKLMSMVQDFEKRQNENNLIASQTRHVDEQTAGETISNMIKNYEYTETLPIDKKIKMSILDKNLIEYENMMYNLATFGSIKGPSSVVKPFFDVFNFVTNENPSRKKISDFLDEIGKGRSQAFGSIFESIRRNLFK